VAHKSDKNELFDPDFLGRLRTLFFMLRKRRQLRRHGVQQTPTAGFTREFKDHRQYSSGDDYRSIDWRLVARLEKLFIRVFEEVQEFHVYILLDRSQSMHEPYPRKRQIELQLAVAIAYLALISQHTVSVFSMADGLKRELRPLKGQGHVHRVLDHLAELEFSGRSDLVASLKQFQPVRQGRGIVFLISDLLGREPELSQVALQELKRWPAETHVIHLLDPQEQSPDLEGDFRLVDVETEDMRRMWLTRRDLAAYEERFTEFLEGLKTVCVHHQADYVTWTTDLAFEDMFVNLLSRGSALAGT